MSGRHSITRGELKGVIHLKFLLLNSVLPDKLLLSRSESLVSILLLL